MKTQMNHGGALLAFVMSVTLILSIVLNALLLTGCVGPVLSSKYKEIDEPVASRPTEWEKELLLDIAERLGVSVSPDMTAPDIATNIRIAVKPVSFNGSLLTEEDIKFIEEDSRRIGTVVRENHKFLSSVRGKKVFVVAPIFAEETKSAK